MSRCRAPPSTSNGVSSIAIGSKRLGSATTRMRLVSMTPHVRTSVNRSPTRTALLSVFHQHLMGSDSTGRRACAFPRSCAAAGSASHAAHVSARTLALTRAREALLLMIGANDSQGYSNKLPEVVLEGSMHDTTGPRRTLRVDTDRRCAPAAACHQPGLLRVAER